MKTKQEIAAQRAEHYLKNKERLIAARRKYIATHLESVREAARQYAAAHREERREYDEMYRAENPLLVKEKARKYNESHATERAEYQRKYRRLHPHHKSKEQVRAHYDVRNALRRGEITRSSLCSKCGKKCKPEAHHADYSLTLEITWICKACHTLEHYPNN